MRRLRARLRGSGDDVAEGDRWLVAGLGNPGARYAGSRHNVGADTVRILADRLGLALRANRKLGGEAADGWMGPARCTLLVPGTYMNHSGGPVRQAMAFYKVDLDRVVVCHDDLDLPLGTVRLKRGGGDGGHNGLKDIRGKAGADTLRVRIGVGRPPGRQDPADYVLKPFRRDERDEADLALARAADAVRDLITEGLEAAQNRHHAK